MKRMIRKKKTWAVIAAVIVIAASAAAAGSGGRSGDLSGRSGGAAERGSASPAAASDAAEPDSGRGRIESVTYRITYDGKEYEKAAFVYVPAAYRDDAPMDILYLLHGSTGSGGALAEATAPLLDEWIADGDMDPLLVVFPTYYPDRSFVTSDYTEDYPLDHFFATSEIAPLLTAVESRYRTYAAGTDDAGLAAGRMHRAFGGYSMGGVTTWEVLAYDARYFAAFMPMAGDAWIDRAEDVHGGKAVAEVLLRGLRENGVSPEGFRIVAMVGGQDGTKYSIRPQIEALREYGAGLITEENLLYWENRGGGHSQESLEEEARHGIPLLFSGFSEESEA